MITIRHHRSGKVLHTVCGESLRETDLTAAALDGADLFGACLVCAVLHGAVLRGADLRGASLAGAQLVACDLTDAALCDADLSYADCSFADLAGADLAGADLSGADLNHAILRGACLRGARLGGAILSDASLHEVDLAGALFDESTRWPYEFDPAAHGASGPDVCVSGPDSWQDRAGELKARMAPFGLRAERGRLRWADCVRLWQQAGWTCEWSGLTRRQSQHRREENRRLRLQLAVTRQASRAARLSRASEPDPNSGSW